MDYCMSPARVACRRRLRLRGHRTANQSLAEIHALRISSGTSRDRDQTPAIEAQVRIDAEAAAQANVFEAGRFEVERELLREQ